ncbi:MAG: hypothetical protein KF892_07305 [Rhizobacter sp.]|nr:hypothetical protein [Rhizobacter sp.]
MKWTAGRMKWWPWIAAAIVTGLVVGSWRVWEECWLGLVCEDGLAAFNREVTEGGLKAGEDERARLAQHPSKEFLGGHTIVPYAYLPTVRGLFGHSFLLENGRLLSFKEALGLHMGLNADREGPALQATAVALVSSPRALSQQDILWSDGRLTRNQHFDARTGTARPGRWTEEQPDSVQIDDGVALASGSNFRLVLRRDGSVWGYGGNDFGQLGTPDENVNNQTLPLTRPVAGLTGVTAIAAGMRHAVALKRDGTVWQWGANNTALHDLNQRLHGGTWEMSSQLPRQRDFFNPEPSRVPGLPDIVKIAAGKNHSVALDKNGAVWAWGESSGGLLGIPLRFSAEPLGHHPIYKVGTFVDLPVRVPGVEQVVDIAAAGRHTIALKRDGTVWGWGMNNGEQLGAREHRRPPAPRDLSGQPSRQEHDPPFPISGLRDIQQIFTSETFSALVDKRGDMFLMSDRFAYDFAARVPGRAGAKTRMRFSLAAHEPDGTIPATLDSEVGLYAVDDALGRVNGLLPGDAGYAAAALAPARATPVFESGQSFGRSPGARQSPERWLKLDADRLFGFYVVFGSNRSAWQRVNPRNGNEEAIKAYFSFPAANPDRLPYGFMRTTFDYQWERSPSAPLGPGVSTASYTLTGHGLRGVDRERFQRDLTSTATK